MAEKIFAWFSRGADLMVFKALRKGLTLTLPVIFIGSFCLIFLNLELPTYQSFLQSLPLLHQFLSVIYDVTLGVFSLYATVSISLSYSQAYAEKYGDFFRQGALFASGAAYLLLAGIGTEGFSVEVLSTRSLFVAILAGLIGSVLYCAIIRRSRRRRGYGSTADNFFNRVTTSVLPIAVVIVLAALANLSISLAFNVSSVEELFFRGISFFFSPDTSPFESGLLYQFLNGFLWFFGIHGGNMLDGVAQNVFVPGAVINAELLAAGLQPTEIVSKSFMDTFAAIGGSGALLSLLLAIVIFGRHRTMKKLSGLATVPIIFNINELMLFGLPVIWNPALLIPFILVPIINFVIAYGATLVGFLPYVSVDVSWITPPLYGGYVATGSWVGVFVQAVCLVIGMLVYLPFLRLYEKTLERSEKENYKKLLHLFRESELERSEIALTDLPGSIGLLVQSLSEDLQGIIAQKTFSLYYQPQFDVEDKAIGAEALLRWNHPVHGMIYPPILIKLADEIGIIDELGYAVLEKTLDDAVKVQMLVDTGALNQEFSLSVNATAKTLQEKSFTEAIIQEVRARKLDPGRLIVEATENDALNMTDETSLLLAQLVDAGIPLAIDDFSMGNTSFKYLETSAFSTVKLDGTIAKGVMENTRYADIVASITRLSEQLNFKVLAEYVETREQRDLLVALGCSYFQGYLYAPALPFDEMLKVAQGSHKS